MQFDILIKNAFLIDGSGAPECTQDLAVNGAALRPLVSWGRVQRPKCLTSQGMERDALK